LQDGQGSARVRRRDAVLMFRTGLISVGRRKSLSLIAELKAVRSRVAGVADEAAAGDDTERFKARDLGHFRHQVVELQAGGVQVFFEFRSQKEGAAQSRQVVRGHLKTIPVGPVAMARGAVDLGLGFRPPGLKHVGSQGKDHGPHMHLPLGRVHFHPGQALPVHACWPHALGITDGDSSDDHQSQKDGRNPFFPFDGSRPTVFMRSAALFPGG